MSDVARIYRKGPQAFASAMTIFSSPTAALKEGFRIDDFDREYQMFIVVKDRAVGARRVRLRAFARATSQEIEAYLRGSFSRN